MVLVTVAFAWSCMVSQVSMADDPKIHGEAASDAFALVGNQAIAGDHLVGTAGQSDNADSEAIPQFLSYRWVSVCQSDPGTAVGAENLECGLARTCPRAQDRLWRLWGRRASGDWDPLGAQCFGQRPTAAQTPQPQVTPAMVLNALRRLGLPALTAQTQPRDKTLVNFATIFYTEPQPFTRTITLLGQQVQVEAVPTAYLWHHGDGTSAATSSPGSPYPSKEITYEYADAHVTVQASVDVTYSARFRVAGGDWQDIDETVTITGPPTALRVSEATAVLSGEY